MIKRELFVVPIKIKLMQCWLVLDVVFLLIKQKEEQMEWHPSGVLRSRLWVIGVNSVIFWSREVKYKSSYRWIQIFRVEVSQVKMTEKWGKIQGKLDLVWVSVEFELFLFELSAGSTVHGFLILIFCIVSIDHTVVEARLTIEWKSILTKF